MEHTLLGMGCPGVDINHFALANLIDGEPSSLLPVNCGSIVTQGLHEAGRNDSKLHAILITHSHSHHIVDLFQLIIRVGK